MHISLKLKLIIGTMALICISSISGIVGYTGMQDAEESLSTITETHLPSLEALNILPYHFQSILLAQTMLLKRNITKEQRAKQYEDIKLHRDKYTEIIKTLSTIPRGYKEKVLWEKFTTTLDEAKRENNKIFDMIHTWENDLNNLDLYQNAFDYCYTVGNRVNGQMFNEILAIIKDTKESTSLAKIETQRIVNRDMDTILIVLGLSFMIGIAISIFIVQKISVPLKKILNAAIIFSQGDFTTRLQVNSDDEIGKTSKYLNKALDTVVDKLHWYENVLNSISFPIMVVSNEKYITYLNDHALKTFHLDKETYIGKACISLGTTICNETDCAVKQCKQGNTKCHFNIPGIPENDYMVDTSILKNRHGDTIGYIELIQDITDVNRLKAAAEQALKDGIHQAAIKLDTTVREIANHTESLSTQIEQSTRGSEAQSTQMDETAVAVEEMNATILEVAKNSSHTSESASIAKQKAHDGTTVIQTIISEINGIRELAIILKNDIHVLGDQVGGINEIIETISHIADQTNLLALNAAIESSHAGEAGKGFAVVADEVRKLAERTQVATRDIETTITTVQDSTLKSINYVEKVASAINEIDKRVKIGGDTLSEIYTLIDGTTSQIQSIAIAAEEQSATAEEIGRLIISTADIAKQNLTAMQHSTKAIHTLSDQTQTLDMVIQEMKK